MKPSTYLLWYGPFLILFIGVVAVFVYFRRQRAAAVLPEALSPEEEARLARLLAEDARSEEHTSELQSLIRISYAVFCLKKKKISKIKQHTTITITPTTCNVSLHDN